MTAYVRHTRFKHTYDGQELAFVLKPLRYADALRIRGMKGAEAVEFYSTLFPGYVESMSPFRDAEGAEVPVEEIATALYFAPLIAEVMSKHLEANRLQDPTAPAAAPAGSSPESES